MALGTDKRDIVQFFHLTINLSVVKDNIMPRHARLDAPGTLHDAMIRGIEGITIFRDDADRKDFLSRLSDLT